ncbi:hypothetical protein HZB96_02600 [Candidatus Gottesmanbacteria bacterium]|nr:hypothetical protein [Candidatus Gottesmanbacteria bacterium]
MRPNTMIKMKKDVMLVIIGGIIIVILAGILIFGKNTKKELSKITDFESCAKAGYPVMLSYPAICKTPDGRTFTQVLTEEEKKKLVPPQ